MDFSVPPASRKHVLFVTPVTPTLHGRGPGFRAYQWVQSLMKQFEKITVLCTSVYGDYDPTPVEFTHHQQVNIFKSSETTSYLHRFLNLIRLKPTTYNSIDSEQIKGIDGLKYCPPELIVGFKITSLPVVNQFKRRFKNAKTALDIDEVNSKRVWDIAKLMKENGLYWNACKLIPEIIGYRILETTALREIDNVIVSTQKEKALFESISTYRPCRVFDNRFPIKRPVPNNNKSPFQFLFVGNSIHYPNRDAIEIIIDKILPGIKRGTTKNFKITIVGGEPEASVIEKLHLYSELTYLTDTEDLESIYKQTDAALIPLRIGSGSSLKVLEALANKKVVISTTTGVRGFTLKHGFHCLISDDMDSLAAHCIHLIENDDMVHRLSENGYEWFLKNQSYETVYP